MIRKTISILLIASMLATLARFALPYVWYYSNYEYITTELCVNRHNPEVECDGFCVLSKRIKTSHDHGETESGKQVPQNRSANQLLVINLFFGDSFSFPSRALLKPTMQNWLSKADTLHLWYGEINTPPPQNSI